MATNSLSAVNLAQAYSAKNWEYTAWDAAYAGAAGGTVYGVTILRFDVPAFVGVSEALDVALVSYLGLGADVTLRWALCTSDSNRELYTKTTAEVADSNQIGSGTVTIPDVTSTVMARNLHIPATKIKGGNTYYLFLWAYNDTGLAIRAVSSGWGDHGVSIGYNLGLLQVKVAGQVKAFAPYVVISGQARRTILYVKLGGKLQIGT